MLHKGNCLALWHMPAAPQPSISASSGNAASRASKVHSSAPTPTSTSAQFARSSGLTHAHDRPAGLQPPAQLPADTAAAADSGAKEADQRCTDAADPQLLASTSVRYKAYSVTRSPDGRLVATGELFEI